MKRTTAHLMLAITIHRELRPRGRPTTTTIRIPRTRTCTSGTKRVPVTRGPRSRSDIRNEHRLVGVIRTRTGTHLLQLLLLLVRRDVLIPLLIYCVSLLLLQIRRCKMVELRMRVRWSYRSWARSRGYVGVLLSINDTVLPPNTNTMWRSRREAKRSTSNSRRIPKRRPIRPNGIDGLVHPIRGHELLRARANAVRQSTTLP